MLVALQVASAAVSSIPMDISPDNISVGSRLQEANDKVLELKEQIKMNGKESKEKEAMLMDSIEQLNKDMGDSKVKLMQSNLQCKQLEERVYELGLI